jgi:hypothetical protein
MAKKKSKANSQTTLGKFFRDLHKKPEQLEKFSSGPAGRKEVIDQSNLKPEHKKLLKTGCVPDIIQALAGVPLSSTADYNTLVVQCCDDKPGCGHPHCEAFSKATAVTITPKTTKKKKK